MSYQLTIQNAIRTVLALTPGKSETPVLDAQVLLAHIVGKPRSWVLTYPETPLTPVQQEKFSAALSKLESGLPLPYILGHWEFYSLDFEVAPSVLIPRPETELLVEQAIAWLKSHPDRRRAADIGTGSGCIAVSLAVNIPDLRIIATDISEPALRIARTNAHKHQVADRITFLQADLLGAGMFDLICANLPYVPAKTLENLDVYGKEPALALDGGPDGLDFIRKLIASAPGQLPSGGLLLLEIEAAQGNAVLNLARETFPEANVKCYPDLAGRDRLVKIDL